jgi:hypothetical protein
VRSAGVKGLMNARAAAVLLLGGTLLAGCGGGSPVSGGEGESRASTSAPAAAPAATPTSGSCVEGFSEETLGRRSFAFDGVVLSISSAVDPQAPDPDVVLGRAEFDVTRWYAGGSGESVSVWMQRPVVVGEHLLVSGEPRWGGQPLDDAIAWECDFTTAYSPTDAASWAGAFGT